MCFWFLDSIFANIHYIKDNLMDFLHLDWLYAYTRRKNRRDCLKFPTNSWLPGQKSWVIFYKTYLKISLDLSKKENWISFLYSMLLKLAVGEGGKGLRRGFFKKITGISRSTYLHKFDLKKKQYVKIKKIWANQSEASKYLVNFMESKNKQTGVLISLRSWRSFKINKWGGRTFIWNLNLWE